jgi:hypothetical protein
MDCIKKLKPIHWVILSITIAIVIYFVTKNEHFTFSLHDSAGSVMLECPDKFNLFKKNFHKIQWNKNNSMIHSSVVHPDDGSKKEIMSLVNCDPSGAQQVRVGLLDLANLLSQMNPNNTVEQTVSMLHQNHAQYAAAFNNLLAEFKNVSSNSALRQCINKNMPMIQNYINSVNKTPIDDMNKQADTLNKLNQILSTYENELGMFKNDLVDYLIVSVNESNLTPEQKTAHSNLTNGVRTLLETAGRITSNTQSSSGMNTNVMNTNVMTPSVFDNMKNMNYSTTATSIQNQ